jgi:hypothetical protein
LRERSTHEAAGVAAACYLDEQRDEQRGRAPRLGIWASALRRGLDGLYGKPAAPAAATEAAAPSP